MTDFKVLLLCVSLLVMNNPGKALKVPHSNGRFVIIETQPKPGGVKETKEKKVQKSGADYFYYHDSSEYYDFPSNNDLRSHCSGNWKTLSTGCYFFEENPMTWNEAKRFCSNLGANMVVVESDDERTGITEITNHLIAKKVRFWIDAKKVGNSWKTHDLSTNAAYSPWGRIPTLQKGNCARSGPETKWYRWDCDSKYLGLGFSLNPLCMKPHQQTIEPLHSEASGGNVVNPHRPVSLPSSNELESSCPDNWKTLPTGCYYFKENPMTWNEAKGFCTNLGANMVVVESDDERNGITEITKHLIAKKVRFWIDAKKIGNSWKTHDLSTDAAYIPWGRIPTLQKGNCIRSGPETNWYRWDCNSNNLGLRYSLNPLCKKPHQQTN